MQRKRDPREPTPLVLMNPELRVRQLRYAANIEATPMVPLYRYYEVLLDLSMMGLEYLKAMKLERAFIIFKRIEYFIFHRLKDHLGAQTFDSEAKQKIMGRMPMIMYVAQQIIVDFVMPVYERQAAYFRYEELQRRLSIVNPTAWSAIMTEAARREAEFYSEAEKISTRFGVELASFLPREVAPDEHHPSNYPPRTYPAKESPAGMQAPNSALTQAIAVLNSTAASFSISADQPIESLVTKINALMNNALVDFFNARAVPPDVHYQISMALPQTEVVVEREANAGSPRVDHMYSMPEDLSDAQHEPESADNFEYKPTYSLDTYVDLLARTYEANSAIATGFRVCQRALKTSTAGFQLYLERDAGPPTTLAPEPDPGAPRATPPTVPLEKKLKSPQKTNWGVWQKRGKDGVGSLAVLSHLDTARETLDAVPPMPASMGQVGEKLELDDRSSEYEDEDEEEEIDVVRVEEAESRKREADDLRNDGRGGKKPNDGNN